MKIVLILIGCLLLVKTPMFAQEVKKDTLTEEQKQEVKVKVMQMLGAMIAGEDMQAEAKRDSIQRVYEQKFKPGTPSPDFHFKDVDGKEYSLKSFRRKYVFIDVWATWCGPCCKEIPFLQKLEEKMKGKNIAFVSISWDRRRADWVKMVKEEKLGGVQLHFGKDEKFFNEYGIDAIPRFILLDKKGKVVKAFMTRPSNPETEKFLLTLKGM